VSSIDTDQGAPDDIAAEPCPIPLGEPQLAHATLMVHLEVGNANPARLRIVGDLAKRLGADIVGIAACQPIQLLAAGAYMAGSVVEDDYIEHEVELKATEDEFRKALQQSGCSIEWRAAITTERLCDYLAREARCADLVIPGNDQDTSVFDSTRHVNTAELVMQTGRPVLVVPASVSKLDLSHVILGWKDTRETRRAALDALPLLKAAARVSVIEIVDEKDLADARSRLGDIASWLKRHDIMAEADALASTGNDAKQLSALGQERGADLVVAGAYGHSRIREWVLGGVTRDLIASTERCSLLSH